jgi:hypothetical protein
MCFDLYSSSVGNEKNSAAETVGSLALVGQRRIRQLLTAWALGWDGELEE